MKLSKSPLFFPLALAALAISSFAILCFSPQKIGANADSLAYISAARSFLAGDGFKSLNWDGQLEVMTHFPPFYSFLVAVFSFGRFDPLQSAKWLNALILFANTILVGLIIHRVSRHEWIALFGAAVFATSISTILYHFSVWTEPLFVLLSLSALWFFGLYLEKKNRFFLVLAAFLVGVGTITRYVGVTLIGTTLLVMFFHPYAPWRRRIYDSLAFTAVACLPLILWLIRNISLTESAANRTIAFHPVQSKDFLSALYVFSLWVLPGIRVTFVASILILLANLLRAILRDETYNQAAKTGGRKCP